jgi:hypothetical protein
MKRILPIILTAIMIAAFFASCVEKPDSYQQNTAAKETTMMRATAAEPVYQVQHFLERMNVNARAKIMDSPEKIFYVYLYNYGVKDPLGYFVIKNKVSSLRSYLVPQERQAYNGAVLQDADIDGTYGENQAGAFMFLVNGTYLEWNGLELVSDQPVIPGVPKLGDGVRVVKEK